MKKLIAVIVVIFILFVMGAIFGFLREAGAIDNIARQMFESYGTIGVFLVYTLYGGLFIFITKWSIKTSWRSITGTQSQESPVNQHANNVTHTTSMVEREYAHGDGNINKSDMNGINDNEVYTEVVKKPKQDNKVKVTTAEPTISNTANEQDIEIDDEVYKQALLEIEENRKVKGTWAKALAKSDGDLSKTEALYIKYRTHAIIEEEKKITQYKTDLENGRLLKSMKNILLKDGYYQYSNKTVYTLGFKEKTTYEVMLDTDKMLLSILGKNGKPVVSYPLK